MRTTRQGEKDLRTRVRKHKNDTQMSSRQRTTVHLRVFVMALILNWEEVLSGQFSKNIIF